MLSEQISKRLTTYFTSKQKLTKMHSKPLMLLNILHPFHGCYLSRDVPPRNLSKSLNASVSWVCYQNKVYSKKKQCCKKSNPGLSNGHLVNLKAIFYKQSLFVHNRAGALCFFKLYTNKLWLGLQFLKSKCPLHGLSAFQRGK